MSSHVDWVGYMELKLTLIARRIKNTDVNLTEYGDIWDTVIYGADDDLTKTMRKIPFKITGM